MWKWLFKNSSPGPTPSEWLRHHAGSSSAHCIWYPSSSFFCRASRRPPVRGNAGEHIGHLAAIGQRLHPADRPRMPKAKS